MTATWQEKSNVRFPRILRGWISAGREKPLFNRQLRLQRGKRGTVQAEALVGDEPHRDRGGDVAMTSLEGERLDEVAFGEARGELRGDTAADVDAAAREERERRVAGE